MTCENFSIPSLDQYSRTSSPTLSRTQVPEDSKTPTFASVVLRACNRRWNGTPFIIRAGKALNQRKVEVRIQFKATPATSMLFRGADMPRNELVIRLQPNEALFMRTNVKAPGLRQLPVQSELDLTYADRYGSKFDNPDAYVLFERVEFENFHCITHDSKKNVLETSSQLEYQRSNTATQECCSTCFEVISPHSFEMTSFVRHGKYLHLCSIAWRSHPPDRFRTLTDLAAPKSLMNLRFA